MNELYFKRINPRNSSIKRNSESRLQKAITIIDNLMKSKLMGFSSYDYVQIYEKGIPLETIKSHLTIFQKGIQKANLVRPATKEDGVIKFSDVDFQYFANYFDVEKEKLKLKKFVIHMVLATSKVLDPSIF